MDFALTVPGADPKRIAARRRSSTGWLWGISMGGLVGAPTPRQASAAFLAGRGTPGSPSAR